MNLEAGINFMIFLFLFGLSNYLIMLKRYVNDLKIKKILQQTNISVLYPKGTFIKT